MSVRGYSFPFPFRRAIENVLGVCCKPQTYCRSVLLGVVMLAFPFNVSAADTPETLKECLDSLPDTYLDSRGRLVKLLKRYRDSTEKIKTSALADLDGRHRIATAQSGPTSHEAMAIKSTFDWILHQQTPPKHAAALPWIVSYTESLIKAQGTLRRQLSSLNRRLIKDGHEEEATIFAAAFQRIETPRLNSDQIVSGRKFKGYRTTTDGKGLTSIQMNFTSGLDYQFAGTFERDHMYRGHPVHEIAGRMDGAAVMLQTGPVKSFGDKSDRAWTYSGYVIGRSIVGRYSGRNSKGKQQGGFFHIRTNK